MAARKRKRQDTQAREVHGRLAANLKSLMDQARDGQGISVLALAEETELGTGSIQVILRDPDHSPSIRVLDRLAVYFKLPGPWVLLGDLDLERKLLYWLATHRLPFTLNKSDIDRLLRISRPTHTAESLDLVLAMAEEMDYTQFRQTLDQIEGRRGVDAIWSRSSLYGLTSF